MAATAIALVGGVAIAAATSGSANHSRSEAKASNGLLLAGAAKFFCKVGFDTQSATSIPPDDSTSDNPPAATVQTTKPCAGHVIGFNMVWTGLRRGVWRFEVLLGGNNSANLQFRAFVVQAFNN